MRRRLAAAFVLGVLAAAPWAFHGMPPAVATFCPLY